MNALQVVFFVIKHDDSVKKPWCCDKKKATTVLQIKSDNMFVTVEDLHSSYLLTQQLLQFRVKVAAWKRMVFSPLNNWFDK